MAGLACAHRLRAGHLVLDRATHAGGTARSFEVEGFTFDLSGHLLHLHHPETGALIRRLLAGNWVECRRSAWIRSHGVTTPYPFQANLNGLPQAVVRECVEGVREARERYGDRPLEGAPDLSFGDWCLRLFGRGISRHFMVPYNRKLWRVSPRDMTPDWCGPFVPVPSLAEVEAGARKAQRKTFGYNARFLYPRRGGIQALAEAFARETTGLRLGEPVEAIDWKRRRARSAAGWLAYRRLVSTLPLPELLKRLEPFPDELVRPLEQLRWTSVHCLNLGVARPRISKASWIYFPEPRYPFYRVGFPMNFTPHVVPRGCSSMYVEVSHAPGAGPADAESRRRLLARVRAGLIHAGILTERDTFPVVHHAPIGYAYVIHDRARREALPFLLDWLDRKAGAFSIGRYGAWKYSFMEEAIRDGRRAAEETDRRLTGS